MYHYIHNPTELFYAGEVVKNISNVDYYAAKYLSMDGKLFYCNNGFLSQYYTIPEGSYLVKLVDNTYGKTFCFNNFTIYGFYKWAEPVDNFIANNDICAVTIGNEIKLYNYDSKVLITTIIIDGILLSQAFYTMDGFIYAVEKNGTVIHSIYRNGQIYNPCNNYTYITGGLYYTHNITIRRLSFKGIQLEMNYSKDIDYEVIDMGDDHYAIIGGDYYVILNTSTRTKYKFYGKFNPDIRITTIVPKYGKKAF